MKIVYCIPFISTSGGVERVTSIKANWLVQHGHEVHIISKEVEVQPFFTYKDAVKLHYIGSLSMPQPSLHQTKTHSSVGVVRRSLHALALRVKQIPLAGALLERGFWFYEYQKYLRLLIKIKPDIIVGLALDQTLSSAMLAYRSSCVRYGQSEPRLLIESHGFRYSADVLAGRYPEGCVRDKELPSSLGAVLRQKLGYKIEPWTENYFYRAMDMVIALTEEDRPNYVGNTMVIPNPITIKSLNETEKTLKEKSAGKFIIAAGRYDPQKNFESLLNIWRQVSPQYPDWELLIYGHGVPSGLGNLAKDLERVRLYETTPNIREEYIKSSIYVMTSKFEGLPLVLLEAQAMGLPIVSYACPCGPKDIVTDGKDGFLVEPGDEATFAEKLSLLMQDEELRVKMAQEALLSSKRFDIDVVMQKWVDLFTNL